MGHHDDAGRDAAGPPDGGLETREASPPPLPSSLPAAGPEAQAEAVAAGRPLTTLSAVLQRWRLPFVEPLFDVQIGWAYDLPPDGPRVRHVAGSDGSVSVRLEVNVNLSDAAAAEAAMLALAALQVEEVGNQVRHLRRRSGAPPHCPLPSRQC
jgi:hypothetical protein